MLNTIAELPEYTKCANQLLQEDEQNAIIKYLAEYPSSGYLIQGTGGIRKLRWSRSGKGKSGGVRVIYYYYNEGFPLYLMTVYSKSEKDNLTKVQRNELAKIAELIKKAFLAQLL
jgi:mRNA-degrading endonuclease RelE of RelBE toxin-antitoxin system